LKELEIFFINLYGLFWEAIMNLEDLSIEFFATLL